MTEAVKLRDTDKGRDTRLETATAERRRNSMAESELYGLEMGLGFVRFERAVSGTFKILVSGHADVNHLCRGGNSIVRWCIYFPQVKLENCPGLKSLARTHERVLWEGKTR